MLEPWVKVSISAPRPAYPVFACALFGSGFECSTTPRQSPSILRIAAGFHRFMRTSINRVPSPAKAKAKFSLFGNARKSERSRETLSLETLRSEARYCKACDLWKNATQTVFGEGPASAKMMLVGEQPGDQEDLQGHPFVGPAGRVLQEALTAAGIDRAEVYVTNVVKHFKWAPAPRGKRRIHKKPRYSEINACRPWLDAELEAIKPEVLVCLGATAAQALLGRKFSVLRERGKLVFSSLAPIVVATVHPSSILRAPDSEARHAQMRDFVRDLKHVAGLLKHRRPAAA
jgi:uracil-DNA glycosylase